MRRRYEDALRGAARERERRVCTTRRRAGMARRQSPDSGDGCSAALPANRHVGGVFASLCYARRLCARRCPDTGKRVCCWGGGALLPCPSKHSGRYGGGGGVAVGARGFATSGATPARTRDMSGGYGERGSAGSEEEMMSVAYARCYDGEEIAFKARWRQVARSEAVRYVARGDAELKRAMSQRC